MAVKISVTHQVPGSGLTPFREGYELPGKYSVRVDDPDLPYLLHLDVRVLEGQLNCTALRCEQRDGGPPVTSEGIRKVPVAAILRHTAPWAALRVEEGRGGVYKLVPLRDQDQESFYEAYRRTGRRRRRELSDAFLAEVAAVYSSARDEGRPPTKTVAEQKHVTRSTASRWVRAARERGLLE